MGRTNVVYRITVLKWEKYNGKKKRGHECIMLSTRFLEDTKIKTLPPGGVLLFLGLLLACGEEASSSIEASHDLLVRSAGGSGQRVQRLLDQLEELQLVTYEKVELLNKEKRKEEKRREKNSASLRSAGAEQTDASSPSGQENLSLLPEVEPQKKPPAGFTNPTWESYALAYRERYGVDPIRNQSANGILARFVRMVGAEEAPKIAEFYVQHPSGFYHQSHHPLNLLLRDAQKIRTEMLTGNIVTPLKARQAERTHTNLSNFREVIDEVKDVK